jgi:hypoxanthine phosphoribosyltransferase
VGRVRQSQAGLERSRPAIVAESMTKMEQHRQRQLALPWALTRTPNRAGFAHPSEAELARIFTFYRIRWLYEPTSFVLRSGPDGRPSESFTPDFFLPDHRLYIELTTMRQSLVTRKNRKLRRLRELYPGVQIKLLYRRDVERLLRAYEEDWRAPREELIGPILIGAPGIGLRVTEMAEEIATWTSGFASDALEVIGLAPGAQFFRQQLGGALRNRGIEVCEETVSLTRYRTESGQQLVRVASAPRRSVAGRDVLVVADVVSTGLSLGYFVDWLRRRGARRVEVCAFFNRSSARLIDVPVRFCGFEAPDEPLIGYGIGLRQSHRNLPYVATLVSGPMTNSHISLLVQEQSLPAS